MWFPANINFKGRSNYDLLTHLTEKQQVHYGCRFIVQVRAKNPCTGYLFPETRKKFDKLADAVRYQQKLQTDSEA